MKTNKKLDISAILWITVAAVLTSRTSAQSCQDWTAGPNCADCPHPPRCKACEQYGSPEGTYGLYVDRPGCGDCNVESDGTCIKCTNMSKCDVCTDSRLGPKTQTTTAECGACAPNCRSCTKSGAGKCDDNCCHVGFAVNTRTQTCSPCDRKCSSSCSSSGPNSCDTCLTGTGLRHGKGSAPDDCEACQMPHCAQCYTDNTKCDVCDSESTKNSSGQCIDFE